MLTTMGCSGYLVQYGSCDLIVNGLKKYCQASLRSIFNIGRQISSLVAITPASWR